MRLRTCKSIEYSANKAICPLRKYATILSHHLSAISHLSPPHTHPPLSGVSEHNVYANSTQHSQHSPLAGPISAERAAVQPAPHRMRQANHTSTTGARRVDITHIVRTSKSTVNTARNADTAHELRTMGTGVAAGADRLYLARSPSAAPTLHRCTTWPEPDRAQPPRTRHGHTCTTGTTRRSTSRIRATSPQSQTDHGRAGLASDTLDYLT